jgi:hypothetical protein
MPHALVIGLTSLFRTAGEILMVCGEMVLRTHPTFNHSSHSLNQWAITEVLGHYVNYRKIVSPKNQLLPESKFQVYAVCTNYPQKLK